MRGIIRLLNRIGHSVRQLMINMLLNLRWSIPAWILLAAYLIFGTPPLWVFWAAIGFWALMVWIRTTLFRLLRRLAAMPISSTGSGSARGGSRVIRTDADTPNKNPYSAK